MQQSINMLIGLAGIIAKISWSHGMLKKTEVLPVPLKTEANSSSQPGFEAWLKTYRKQLEESRIASADRLKTYLKQLQESRIASADRGVSSFSWQNRGASRGEVAC